MPSSMLASCQYGAHHHDNGHEPAEADARGSEKRFNPDFSGLGRASSPDREESGLSSMAVFVHPLVSHTVTRWSSFTGTRTTPEE
jgi:hypothetical protein